ncbi:MAG: DUF1643 domain-containing protein [Planctomycetota bacterium]
MKRLPIPDDMRGGASFSRCRAYRYTLTRKWSKGPRLCFVGMNPSTADATHDDPTIRLVILRARREGFCELEAVNLFALRSTDPKGLLAVEDPVGPRNAEAVRRAIERSDAVFAGWGRPPIDSPRVRAIAAASGPLCLGITKSGEPRHPLYLPKDAELIPWLGTATAQ